MEKIQLENGLRVLLLPVEGARSVSASVWVEAGSRYETLEEQGISHFVEHMLFKGTATRSAREISEEMDRLGGTLNAYTTQEYTRYYAQSLPENAAGILDILSDMLLHAAVSEQDTELERRVILDEIAMYEDEGEELAHESLCALVWQGSPLGRPICGARETVSALTPAALRRYIRDHYTPERMIAAVAGSFRREEVLSLLTAGLGALPRGNGRPAADTPRFHPGAVQKKKEWEQVSLELGFAAPPAGSEERYAMMLLNFLVGGGASSRLFQRLREELGLAYSVYSASYASRNAGLFTISAGVAPDQQERLLREIRRELEALPGGITEEEFQRAKAQTKASFILGTESVAARTAALGRNELVLGREVTEDEVLAALDGVTRGEVNALAHAVFHGTPCALAAAGPVESRAFYEAFV